MWHQVRTRPLEDTEPAHAPADELLDDVVARDFLGPIIHERVPEIRSSYSEADETLYPSRSRQPLMDLLVVLATPENDAADFIATTAPSGGHNILAVL